MSSNSSLIIFSVYKLLSIPPKTMWHITLILSLENSVNNFDFIPYDFKIFTRLLKARKDIKQIEHINKVAQFGTFIKRGEFYVLIINGKEMYEI